MAGIHFLQRVKPDTPTVILVSRLAAVREIRTEARHADAVVRDYARRNDVRYVRATAGADSETVPGPLAPKAVV